MNKASKRLGIYLANSFEYYGLAVYSAIQYYIAVNFFPESAFGEHAAILAWFPFILRFLSRPFGGLLIGAYADHYGRKAALVFTSALTGIATLLMGLLPTYHDIGIWAPILFFVMQLMQAFAFGGEFPTAISYLMETSKQNQVARIGAALGIGILVLVAFSLGLVALLEVLLTKEQMLEYGWRIPVIIGVVNIFISYYFRRKLIDSSHHKASKKFGIDVLSVCKIFLIFVPNTIIFYSNTVSNRIIVSSVTDDPSLQSILPIVFNLMFVGMCYLVGRSIDRYSSVPQTMKYAYGAMIVFAVPIYALQSIDHWSGLLISQICIAFLVAVTLSCTPAAVFQHSTKEHRIANIGLGINLAVVLVGASIPMLVTILSQYSQAYVGLLLSFGGTAYFASMALDKYIQNQPQRVQTA